MSFCLCCMKLHLESSSQIQDQQRGLGNHHLASCYAEKGFSVHAACLGLAITAMLGPRGMYSHLKGQRHWLRIETHEYYYTSLTEEKQMQTKYFSSRKLTFCHINSKPFSLDIFLPLRVECQSDSVQGLKHTVSLKDSFL